MNYTGIQATLKNISCLDITSEKDATCDNMLTCLLNTLLPRIHVPCHPFQDENEYHIALLAKPMHVCVYIYQTTCPKAYISLLYMAMDRTLDFEEYSCIIQY